MRPDHPRVSGAPHYALTLDHVTEAALTHPERNAAYVPRARAKAQQEITLLQQCLDELEPSSRQHREISEDMAWIQSLLERKAGAPRRAP